MIDLLGDGGPAGEPEFAGDAPSFIWAPSVRRGSWACWAMTPSNAFTYSSARRMISGSETQKPSSVKTRTRARESAMAPSSASRSPASPTVTAPIGLHGDVAGGAAQGEHLLDDAGGVRDRAWCSPWRRRR